MTEDRMRYTSEKVSEPVTAAMKAAGTVKVAWHPIVIGGVEVNGQKFDGKIEY